TLGYEKINNWAFSETDEIKFIETLTSNQPAPPHHFTQMKKINQFGMELYQPYNVCSSYLNARIAFDLRSKEAFHGGHTEGTINIPYNQNFINQIGWYLDYENSIDLIGDKSTVEQAAHTLQLIGFDNVAGYRLPKSEILTKSIHKVDMTGKEESILEVRIEEEWNNGDLDQPVNIPNGKLLNENISFNKENIMYVPCQASVRSSNELGILENKIFENVENIRQSYQDFPESLK